MIMANHQWLLLEKLQASLKQATDVPNGFIMALAERLDEAILASSRAQLDALNAQLTGLFDQLVQLIPPETALAALQTSTKSSPENMSYLLGQIGFAQLLAAQAGEHRVDDNFAAWLTDSRYKAYIDALARRELTGKELAQVTGEADETVSRKLRFLREQGMTEFRREGNRLFNYLTPAARSLVNDKLASQDLRNGDEILIKVDLTPLAAQTSPAFRHFHHFAKEATSFQAGVR